MTPQQHAAAIAFAVIIGFVVLLMGVSAYWPEIKAWLFAKLDQANEPLDPNDHGDPL